MTRLLWPTLLGLVRTAYAAYAIWCLLFPLAALGWLALWVWGAALPLHPWIESGLLALLALYLGFALYGVWVTYRRREADDPNPWQSGFLAWFGTLKLFRNRGGADAVRLVWPSSHLVENPRGYRISGQDMREVLTLLQPGDILLRGYEGYVDGVFIRKSAVSAQRQFKPGWFTHAALYVGSITEADRLHVPEAFRQRPDYFRTGPQQVIHSMARGVHTEDILTFLRCDYLAVLRLPEELRWDEAALATPQKPSKQSSPPSASDGLHADLLQALQAGQRVPREQAVAAARLSALERIGEDYDFDCSDTKEFDRFSCAELVYFCLRGVLAAIDLKPLPHAFYPFAPRLTHLHFLERVTITPDDFHHLSQQGRLDRIWTDGFSRRLV